MVRMQTTLRRLIQAGCAALFLAGGAAHAQSDDLTIAYVNMQQVVERSPQSQRVMQSLSEEFQPRQRELQQKQAELQEKQETYERDASVMGEQERSALEREIRDGQRELQRLNETINEDFNLRRNEEVNSLYSNLLQRVQSYAEDQGYDLVVGDSIYASDEADITAEVVQAIQDGN